MIDGVEGAAVASGGTRRLAEAVRQAKIAAASRSDVVVDIREADRARLEILQELLDGLIADLPADSEFFDFALSGGLQPRLWIDATAHVAMARDRRTYRLSRETRVGRVLLAEATDPRVMADRVTDYVAERIVERDRALAVGDGIAERVAVGVRSRAGGGAAADPLEIKAGRAKEGLLAAMWLMLGIVLGAGALLALAYYRGFALN
ncbi:hypothetical protein [Antarcticirhabdus aurantiaca]|uniref:Uncharacterized protein n=1 Tax=Antarcticirhabdus aurantiaca TaxID=2606717 RepID=A0ACD4NTJ4_9HYPH|nr:hypothetical protein [Antarcticirhabdus aurantiaca]WAJ30041.1 hypothetical protein OXU80_07470 [Jeongeuplla avenae]